MLKSYEMVEPNNEKSQIKVKHYWILKLRIFAIIYEDNFNVGFMK